MVRDFDVEGRCDTIVLREGVIKVDICKIEDCSRPVAVRLRGLCSSHAVTYYRKNSPATRTCSFEACERKYYAVGLCHTHYEQKRRHGYVTGDRVPVYNLVCGFEGCGVKQHANGYCKTHYQQQYLGRELTPVNRRGITTDTVKECMDCHVVKPHSAYYKEKKANEHSSGLKSYCKPCFIERVRLRKLRKEAKIAGGVSE